VNGQLADEEKLSEAVPLNIEGISYIGGYRTEDRQFYGVIRSFGLWDTCLKPGDFKNNRSSDEKPLIYYEFDELEGLIVKDLTGNFDAEILEKEIEFPEMPRFGNRLELPGSFNRLSWFGRGPHENYWDRKTSAFVGLYESSVDDQYFPYIRPQENGNKTDTRWIALQDEQGMGMMFIGEPLLSFSALPYTMEDLDQESKQNYRHTNDLVKRNYISLNVDYKQTGVGGDDSWHARPHPKYTLKYGEYEYSYIIRPIKDEKDLMEYSRKRNW
jgi:hypothetical protein